MRVWQAIRDVGVDASVSGDGLEPGVEAWKRGPISRLLHPRSTPGMAWRCPGERVGCGGGLPGAVSTRGGGGAPPTAY